WLFRFPILTRQMVTSTAPFISIYFQGSTFSKSRSASLKYGIWLDPFVKSLNALCDKSKPANGPFLPRPAVSRALNKYGCAKGGLQTFCIFADFDMPHMQLLKWSQNRESNEIALAQLFKRTLKLRY